MPPHRLKDNLILKNTLWMMLGQTGRILLQVAYFIILARTLGPQGYGAFVGVTALVAILSPFGSLGSGNILIKHVARDPRVFERYWGNALILTVASGVALLAAVVTLSPLLLPDSIPLALVWCAALTDLLFARLIDVSGQAYQAFQRLERTALLQVLVYVGRLAAVVAFLFTAREHTPTQWGGFYLASAAVVAVTAVWLVNRELGAPRPAPGRVARELKEGLYFSVSLSAASIYNDIDKMMLARYANLRSAGIYGAAYRAIDVSFTPVRSLLFAAYARFFQHGVGGARGSLRFALRLLPPVVLYSLFAGGVLYCAAPVIPWILGAEYQEAIETLRWLALLPLLKTLHYFAADALTGADHQGLRSGLQLVVAGFNVAINIWLIPAYSWRGAAWSSLASDGLLAFLLWIALIRRAYKPATDEEGPALAAGRESR